MGNIGMSDRRTYERLLEIVAGAQDTPETCAMTILKSGLSEPGIRKLFNEIVNDSFYGIYAIDVYEEYVKIGGRPLPNLTKGRLNCLRRLAAKPIIIEEIAPIIENNAYNDIVYYGPLPVAANG